MAIYKVSFDTRFELPIFDLLEFQRISNWIEQNPGVDVFPRRKLQETWPEAFVAGMVLLVVVFYHLLWSVFGLESPKDQTVFWGFYVLSIGFFLAFGDAKYASIKIIEGQRQAYYTFLINNCIVKGDFDKSKLRVIELQKQIREKRAENFFK
jgi:hypothetical protein